MVNMTKNTQTARGRRSPSFTVKLSDEQVVRLIEERNIKIKLDAERNRNLLEELLSNEYSISSRLQRMTVAELTELAQSKGLIVIGETYKKFELTDANAASQILEARTVIVEKGGYHFKKEEEDKEEDPSEVDEGVQMETEMEVQIDTPGS